MTWLVLASEYDPSARWAADSLSVIGLDPVTFITDADLVGASWQHRLGANGVDARVTMQNGIVIESHQVRGTLNRLTHLPNTAVNGMTVEDRLYAYQEFSGLMLSWLESLPGKILNPPTARGFCGAWRSPAEWASLAIEAELPVVTVRSGSGKNPPPGDWEEWPPHSPITEDVIVVDNEVFAHEELKPKIEAACCRFAVLADTPVIGLVFRNEELCGATPLPDLSAGGPDLARALARALGAP